MDGECFPERQSGQDRRSGMDRRQVDDRRGSGERRGGSPASSGGGACAKPYTFRAFVDRRSSSDRRNGEERRWAWDDCKEPTWRDLLDVVDGTAADPADTSATAPAGQPAAGRISRR